MRKRLSPVLALIKHHADIVYGDNYRLFGFLFSGRWWRSMLILNGISMAVACGLSLLWLLIAWIMGRL